MKNKKQIAWIIIISAAVLVSMAIIFMPVSAFSGFKQYTNNEVIESGHEVEPELVADTFYSQYLESFGEPASGSGGNPLADREYRHNEYLTASFIQHVDELLEDMDPRGGYDPFLCAQDIPGRIRHDRTFHHNGVASVIMRSDFPDHVITLDLFEEAGSWKIGNISCGRSPDEVVRTFYTWYLAYIGDRSSGEFNNPLVEGAYQDCGFLSERLIAALDEAAADGFPADPILMAQDVPSDFSVDPGMEPGSAVVHLQFGTETLSHLKVSLVEELGSWKIDRIEKVEP